MGYLSNVAVGALAMGASFASAVPLGDPPLEDDLETANNKRLFYTGILFVSGAAIGLCSSMLGCLTQSLITYRTMRAERQKERPAEHPSRLRGWKSFRVENVEPPSPNLVPLQPRDADF